MNKKQVIASLNKIASQLDNHGLYKDANTITKVMIKLADEFNIESPSDEKENRKQEMINNTLDTKIMRNNIPDSVKWQIDRLSEQELTIREVVDHLLQRTQEYVDFTISQINKGKRSADEPIEDNILRMLNQNKEDLSELLEIYHLPPTPVFYYMNKKGNEIIENVKPEIERYKDYHSPELFYD